MLHRAACSMLIAIGANSLHVNRLLRGFMDSYLVFNKSYFGCDSCIFVLLVIIIACAHPMMRSDTLADLVVPTLACNECLGNPRQGCFTRMFLP